MFSINGNFPQLCKIEFNGINKFWDDSIDSLTENYDDAYGRKTWAFWKKGHKKIGLHRGPQSKHAEAWEELELEAEKTPSQHP